MGTRQQRAKRNAMVREYRKKMRDWTIRVMPSMPEDQWTQFTEWVAAWGQRSPAPRMHVRNRLTKAKEIAASQTHFRIPYGFKEWGHQMDALRYGMSMHAQEQATREQVMRRIILPSRKLGKTYYVQTVRK